MSLLNHPLFYIAGASGMEGLLWRINLKSNEKPF